MAIDAATAVARAQELLDKAYAAQKQYAQFVQDRVDRIIANMAKIGYENAERLARMAVDETKIGKYEDKIVKNRFASKNFYDSIKDMKTAGIIARDPEKKVIEIAAPMGVVTAIIPTTNPTSTVIFKCMASLKSRNAVVISPHPRAIKCCMETARLMEEAAVAAGAPAGLIQCLDIASMDAANELMHNDKVAVILATGGTGLVKAAYSSGKPAYGVGPGNVPAYIERSADISMALDKILASKTFDNGTICASEQSIIVEKVIYDQAKALLQQKGGYFVTGEDAKKLAAAVIKPGGGMNADVVGKAPQVIADLAGISMPEGTRVLVVEQDKVGADAPLSAEKLCPVLAFYTVENWEEACELCMELLEFGGLGHSLSIHSNNDMVVEQFGLLKPVSRILVNSPSAQGGIGYTTGLAPSLTLGCGTFGGNIASENITPLHLMNKKRIAYYNAPADFELPVVAPVKQTGYSRADIVAAVEKALRNLRG